MPITSPQLPYDLQGAQDELTRKKSLIAGLLQGAMQPSQGQMVSGHYVAPGAADALSKLAQTYILRNAQGNLQQQTQDLGQQYNTRLASGLQQYLGNNQPGQTLGDGQAADLLQNDVDPGKLAEPSRDPHAAAATAIASGVPELKQIGLADMQAMAAGLRKNSEPETYNHQPVPALDATGKLVLALTGNKGGQRVLQGLTPPKENLVVDNRVVDKNDPTKVVADYRDRFGPPTNVNGETVQFNVDTNKPVQTATRPPQTNITNNPVIAAQKAGMSKWADLAGTTVSQMADEARGSIKLLGTLNQLEASGKAGIFTGPTANAQTFLAGLGQTLGVPVDANKLANSQTFDAASISAWQDMIKAAGGNRGVVKEEAQRIAQMVPQLAQSPQGRQQLLTYLRQSAQQNISDATQAQREYAKALHEDDPRAFTFGLGTAQIPREVALPDAPGASSPSGAAPMSLDDYIRLHQR